MSTNRELLKTLRSPEARFYPCDFHVHSLGSADVCIGDRFSTLSPNLQTRVRKLARIPDDPGEYDRQMMTTVPPDIFYEELLARRDAVTAQSSQSESNNWAFLAITDHNTAYYASALSRHAWAKHSQDRLVILPGMELEVCFPFGAPTANRCPIHLLCIFPPCTDEAGILLAVNNARASTSPPWKFGCPLEIEDLPSFVQKLRSNMDCPACCVAAHVSSSKGIESEPKMVILDPLRAEIARIEGALERARADGAAADEQDLLKQVEVLKDQCDPGELHLEVLRLIGKCGFDAIQVSDQSDEVHFRRLHRFQKNNGRATPIVCSDAHAPENVFSCSNGIPYLKVSQVPCHLSPLELFTEIRDRAILFGETRTTYSTPGRVTHWIEGIEITPDAADARRFWNVPQPASTTAEPPPVNSFLLPLSPNLNCLVGGRGSGKSAAVEAIAFITQPKEFADVGKKAKRDWPEWYGRAVATLRGCQVRLIFKTTSTAGIGALPKRALIASRYFDLADNHGAVELRDVDSQTVVDSAAKPPRVSIFRVHEIEQAAQPENLRHLFDHLCGEEVAQLSGQIHEKRSEIMAQRETVLKTCQSLAELTAEGSALRQYGIRKQQFAMVNRAEIQHKYASVDQSQAVSLHVEKTVESWDEIDSVLAIANLDDSIGDFFTQARASVSNEEGQPKDCYASLHQLVSLPSPETQNEHERAIHASLQQAQTVISSFGEKLTAIQTEVNANRDATRDELAKAGLPPGSRDREMKKLAFDEAEKSLAEYRRLTTLLDELLKQRQEYFGSLVALCEKRTKLRKETADELTRQLAQDLDAEILKVEVDARPIADRTLLETWLNENVGPAFQKFRTPRLKALLESGILPRDLVQIFLHDPAAQPSLLRVEKTRADEGRIEDADIATIISICQGKNRVAIEGFDEFPMEVRDSLPSEIRDGLWSFPVRAGKNPTLKIDAVLQLDELVLDDLPEIRLNDRPSDPATTCRPLSELSPGQRCSAILPVLLLSGDTPLIIDQPEENLDNRLIRQVIVNILASMKLRRQVIVATHNPNLPVLGDAEQCIVLQASGRDEATVLATGVLDSPQVASFITEIMEGGREAFQYRQSVYQAHWNSVIDEKP